MAKLYFKYGAMGSSKTAQALITKFNYEEKGMRVWLIKPSTDNRDGELRLASRVGLDSDCTPIDKLDSVTELFDRVGGADVIIADECQFFTEAQIDQMREIVNLRGIPVLCFGLRTDFKTRLFEGSKRLFEVADSIAEIKTICECGRKATVNARIGDGGEILTKGARLLLGGNERYTAMCHKCWSENQKRENNNENN